MNNTSTLSKKEIKQQYKEACKLNKPFINGSPINPKFQRFTDVGDEYCVIASNASKIIVNEDKRYNVVKNAHLTIRKGEFVMIFGESGSGKTSFLSLLSGLERPSNGNVNLLGFNTAALKNSELTKLRFDSVGYIFQQYGLLKDVSLFENIIVAIKPEKQKQLYNMYNQYKKQQKIIDRETNKIIKEFICESYLNKCPQWSVLMHGEHSLLHNLKSFFPYKEILTKDQFNLKFNKIGKLKKQNIAFELFKGEYIYDIIQRLEIDNLLDTKIINLSGGQQQRVSIARAVAKQPVVLFADEPTGAVDSQTAKLIMKLFVDLNKQYKTTVIMVSHNKQLMKLGDRLITIKDGEIESNKTQKRLTINEVDFE
ncbi:MAG: ABC transporter ATP-binding protein [Mycoplasma sp.]